MGPKCILLGLLLTVVCGKDISRDGKWKSHQDNQKLDVVYGVDDAFTKEQVQAEIIMDYLPFKLPFKIDKHQKVAALRIMKLVGKPIIRSKELYSVVEGVDNFISSFVNEQNTKQSMSAILDIVQDLVQTKDSAGLRKLIHEVFGEFNQQDKIQGRSSSSSRQGNDSPFMMMMERYLVGPIVTHLIEPMQQYVSSPMANFVDRISRYMGLENEINYDENYRWSRHANNIFERAADYSRQIKSSVVFAKRFLETQETVEEARCGSGACGSVADDVADTAEFK